MKQLFFLFLISFTFTCCFQKKNAKQEQLERTLLSTQQIFHHYTSYLIGEDIREKKSKGIQLLKAIDTQIKAQNSLNNNNNLLGLTYRISYYDTIPPELYEVYFGCSEYGIAWRIKVDSLLNSINTELRILQLK